MKKDGIRKFIPDLNRINNTHPVHIEFIAVPKTFDIRSYLSIREITGQFMSQDITLESVCLVADTIKESPIFTLSSPSGTYAASALFVIEILKQIGLTMKAFSNFIPIDVKSYESLLKNTTFTNSDGKPVIDMTIIFINAYNLVESNVLKPIIEAITIAEDYAVEMTNTANIYNS
jgi:hypothetical protein